MALALAALACVGLARPAHAICDVVPQPEFAFPGATATSNRVYASQGDVLVLTRDAAGCDAGTPAFSPIAANNLVTLVYTPPQGAKTAVVLGPPGYCAGAFTLNGYEAACEAQLGGGGQAFCEEQTVAIDAESLSFPVRTQGRAGPVKIAASAVAAAPPCQIATTSCASQPGLAACVDEIYSSDGTCETGAVHRHASFPGVTVLPPPNDFSAICDSADPSIPCNNSGADVGLTTDAAGNLVIPINWAGVKVPGTLPVPRIVQATSDVPAFTGPPPEPTQSPGAAIAVPGLGFLQSFSPRGLAVDPLFNPLTDPNSSDTALFGSADADRGVLRILRRSPRFRECVAGARAGQACIADVECPGSTCGAARCRGGNEDGSFCTSDLACSGGGECGPSVFDFEDRYSAAAGAPEAGPILLSSANYTAEAQNPAAIDGLVATPDLFMFVRSEPLESKDLNLDGDDQDDTVISIRSAQSAAYETLGSTSNLSAVGPASTRVRQFPFAFPAVAVEDDVVALLTSEPDDGGDVNADGDEWDTGLRIVRMEGGGPVELLAASPAADALTRVDRASLQVSDGLVFFRESELAGAPRATTTPSPSISLYPTYGASMTPDGRYVGVTALAASQDAIPGDTNDCGDAYVLDRDLDADDVFDEVGQTEILIASVSSGGVQGTLGISCDPLGGTFGVTPYSVALSGDGRHAVFASQFPNLVPGDTNGEFDVFVHDRDADADGTFDEPGAIATLRVNLTPAGAQSASGGTGPFDWQPTISADGRWIVYASGAGDLVAGDGNGATDVFARDRDTDEDGVFDEVGAVATVRLTDAAIGGDPTGGVTLNAAITRDGRHVVFSSSATNLDASPLEGVFVLDRDSDRDGTFDEPGSVSLRRISITTEGEIVAPQSYGLFHISADGRRVVFGSLVGDLLAAGGPDPASPFFLHDRDADEDGILDEPGGIETRRVIRSQATRAASSLGQSPYAGALTPDGRTLLSVASSSSARFTDRIDLDTGVSSLLETGPPLVIGTLLVDPFKAALSDGAASQVYAGFVLDGVDTAAPPNDLSVDGDQTDVVLAVADARDLAPVAIDTLGPADAVAVAGGNAVFLRPEAATGAGVFLNDDVDTTDRVVQLWRNRQGGAPVNLGLAAERVALSTQWIAALVSEAGEDEVLNVDGLKDDLVVHVNPRATATSASWTNLEVAADAVQVVGRWVAFTVPQPGGSRLLRVYDAQAAQYLQLVDALGVPLGDFAVDDFVLGDQVIAFRVNETAQGQNLNGVVPPIPAGVADADQLDSVLHVASLATGRVFNSRQAAIPCPVEACDPRVPYRITGTKVTYLTLEAHQGENDLDQNGDGGTGLVLQHFNPDAIAAGGSDADASDILGGALGGICTSSATACATDLDCAAGGICYFPPGGCLLDSGVLCNPVEEGISTDDCTASQFCAPVLGLPGTFTCQEITGPCLTDGECTPPEFCTDDGDNAERLFGSFRAESDGRQRFVSRGRCSDGDGACASDADCTAPATCEQDVTVVATAADGDGDGLADPIDNCIDRSNGDQRDSDGDGAGDACDRATCGNGVQEYSVETCDDGDQDSGDGCSADCHIEGGSPACSNGLDDDGDGLFDFVGGDPGCTGAGDSSERQLGLACDDGLDSDGDFGVDQGDPGCAAPGAASESPQCSDGLDNDGDAASDFPADPDCASASGSSELPICSNGLDDDGDGLVDHPTDPGCSSPVDSSELGTAACDDGVDNDGDELIDFPADPDCASASDSSEDPPPICSNGLDDDGDGLVDHPADPGCSSASDTSELSALACDDGVDNDGDGVADFPDDPGCSGATDTSEKSSAKVCDDGVDNDGDSQVDFPADSGCYGPGDGNEAIACSDGVDNDGDGLADHPADPGCSAASDDSEKGSLPCDDGIDNDGDFRIDFPADAGCVSPTIGNEQFLGCNDGIDNEATPDGLVDWPADPGCSGPTDVNETSTSLVCDNTSDDDSDGPKDYPADSGCYGVLDPTETPDASVCNDGLDNDSDGQTDFPADPGCAGASDPSERSNTLICDNGIDNDGDLNVDYPFDAGCTSLTDASERGATACDDGLDNDADFRIDYPADTGCSGPGDPSEDSSSHVCDNGIDDDADGLIDYPDDSGCSSLVDPSEQPSCSDGLDNDFDTLTDFPADPGCASANDASELGTTQCDDGIDNDSDSDVDYPDDPHCASPSDTLEAAQVCEDGVDNDVDGQTDFPADPGCADPNDASETSPSLVCDDGADNDGDGQTDFPDDPGCAGPADGSELGTLACDDGVDNDDDGQVDFPDDVDCSGPGDASELPGACNDGLDNDADGASDYPADAGCSSAGDDSERGARGCDNGTDNDLDGLIDFPADPGCSSPTSNSEKNSALECDDNVDDDGDGFADFPLDPGCTGPTDASERSTGAWVCDDGADNDADTLIDDPADPGCPLPTDPSEESSANLCSNGLDDDGDGATDFPADTGCANASDESEKNTSPPRPPTCDDGVDGDGDGLIDYPADPGCTSTSDTSENGTAACDDAADNDGDARKDFPADPGCASATDTSENDAAAVCDDGLDNDGDGASDFPADPGCISSSDASEKSTSLVCDNGADDDGDGTADFPADPGCLMLGDTSEKSLSLVCDDALDNDGDGLADAGSDPGCSGPADGSEKSPSLVCDDGADNDGDALVDFPADPGCSGVTDPSEAAQCGDGLDNDGDGRVDHPSDPGCSGSSDDSEKSPSLVCDDGVDNDADTRIDFPLDPGCASPTSFSEKPQCQDGLNNDGQAGIDFDGGNSLDLDDNGFIDAAFNPATPAVGSADPQCNTASRNWEKLSSCGIGFELAFLLPPLLGGLARARRRAARVAS
jgi:cysteine-rich repeat protein